jgi:hypothetical protein
MQRESGPEALGQVELVRDGEQLAELPRRAPVTSATAVAAKE